ncbi:MAG TPA: hypothetical protein VFQ61_02000, partial [Polyangiaceae bacterium]|nr:hypothetical protein [Polyangiaceae bacterium]
MRRPHLAQKFMVLSALSGALLSASLARAQCGDDSECAKGFSCQVLAVSCVAPACPPGQDCPTEPECDASEVRDCVPAKCSSDSDCA